MGNVTSFYITITIAVKQNLIQEYFATVAISQIHSGTGVLEMYEQSTATIEDVNP